MASLVESLVERTPDKTGPEKSRGAVLPEAQVPKDLFTDVSHVPALLTEMQHEFDKLKTKGQDFVTTKQLGAALEDPKNTGGDAAVVASLYRIDRDLRTGDLALDAKQNSQGLTFEQLADFANKVMKAPGACLTNANESSIDVGAPALWASVQFSLAHKPETGRIMLSDIDKSIATTFGDSATKKSLTFFKDHYQEICTLSSHSADIGVTFEDLQYFATKYKNDCTPLWDMRSNVLSHQTVVADGIPKSLYTNESNALESINRKGIAQGAADNCYFQSALGSVADEHKNTIVSMIKDNGNGTFTVNFPNTTQKYTVTKPTEAERIIYNRGAKGGDWSSVAEKAFGLWFNDKAKVGAVQAPGEVPQEYSSHPDYNTMVIKLLTGGNEPNYRELGSIPEDQLEKSLKQDFLEKKVVVAARMRSNLEQDELIDLPTNHSYEVVAYNPAGPEGGTLTICNPWAGADNTFDGEFEVSMQKFKQSFYYLSEEK